MEWHKLQRNEKTPNNFPTFEHLNDKYTYPNGRPARGRIVLACSKCNNDRNKEIAAKVPLEVLWEKSKAYPTLGSINPSPTPIERSE